MNMKLRLALAAQTQRRGAFFEEALRVAARPSLLTKLVARLRHPASSRLRKVYRDEVFRKKLDRILSRTILRSAEESGPQTESLSAWFDHYRPKAAEIEAFTRAAEALDGPIFSILMPLLEPDQGRLDVAIESVVHQAYGRWEVLCVGQGLPALIHTLLERRAAADRRIRTLGEERSGLPAALNVALAAASGDYIMVLDPEGALEPQALFRFATAAVETGADVIYADEVVTEANDIDQVRHVTCRPAFSHDYYLSHPYFTRPVVVRRSIASAAGFDESLRGAHEVDFLLKAIERAGAIAHVPDIVHRTRLPNGVAGQGATRVEVMEETKRSILAHLTRLGYARASVKEGAHFNQFQVRRNEGREPRRRITVIIPTKNGKELLERCLETLRATVELPVSIVVVDHASDEPATRDYLRKEAERGVRILPYSGPFNFSRINNHAVREAGGGADFYLFLNNDIRALQRGWLEAMLDFAERPDVGVVGATLLYPDGGIQHAGVPIGLFGAAGHVLRGMPFHVDGIPTGQWERAVISARDWGAITGACMLMRTDVFQEVDGFDERFAVGFGDTDLALRIRNAGYKVLNLGWAVLEHAESATRGMFDTHPADTELFQAQYRRFIEEGDDYYSPLLSLRSVDWSLRVRLRSPPSLRPRVVRVARPSVRGSEVAASAIAAANVRVAAEPRATAADHHEIGAVSGREAGVGPGEAVEHTEEG
jgi:GT2 family glycosyltransferase